MSILVVFSYIYIFTLAHSQYATFRRRHRGFTVKRRHRSRGTTVTTVPTPAITAVFVIKFNPITAVTAVVPSSPSTCSCPISTEWRTTASSLWRARLILTTASSEYKFVQVSFETPRTHWRSCWTSNIHATHDTLRDILNFKCPASF